jgi:hypothetical protein
MRLPFIDRISFTLTLTLWRERVTSMAQTTSAQILLKLRNKLENRVRSPTLRFHQLVVAVVVINRDICVIIAFPDLKFCFFVEMNFYYKKIRLTLKQDSKLPISVISIFCLFSHLLLLVIIINIVLFSFFVIVHSR